MSGKLTAALASLFRKPSGVRTIEQELDELRAFQRPDDARDENGRPRTLADRFLLAKARKADAAPETPPPAPTPGSELARIQAEVHSAKQRLGPLRAECEMLRAESKGIQAAIATRRREIESLQTGNERVRAEIASIENNRSAAERMQIARLEFDVRNMKAELSASRKAAVLLCGMAVSNGVRINLPSEPMTDDAFSQILNQQLENLIH